MTFEDLHLSKPILQAIADCGYTEPTPIQAQAIPHVLMARDVVGIAQTGTGKTASFTLPMIEILHGGRAKARMPRSLVLSPTRELAAQIAANFDQYGTHTKLEKALLTGGTSMGDQIKKLEKGVDVLIATPGRLLDLFERGQILLNDIKILVIDEADRMLDMGFIPDIERIIGLVPFTRQTLLFSATFEPEIQKLAEKFLSSYREVKVSAPASTAKTVTQRLVKTTPRNKKKTLEGLIKNEKVDTAFIFCNRKRDIDGVVSYLQKINYDAKGLHGDMAQSERTKTLKLFKDGELKLLVCSDVAARGIDIDSVGHVINYDIPHNADDYVHRVGRTGRAGKSGAAFTFVTDGDEEMIGKIESHSKQTLEYYQDGKPSGNKPEKKNIKAETPKRETLSKSEKLHKNAAKPSKKHSKKNDDNDDGGVTGFGNETPAFFSVGS